jgi:hypothetical protein
VCFIGNAPMAHLEGGGGGSGSGMAEAAGEGSTTFYMLAQVQKDPWPVELAGGYSEHAWVTRGELPKYLLQEEASLAERMLL